ncbi:Crp/Fnr family transcriptional regulator [Ulvibacterium marinum]|uniref:Crp/Fnr family transcriptional regulator n=1 Tax=Ulvibacterium marinum TaxID=2419782 RepID=A0A3B0CG84_9FLAO|nr:Crp/Fnr family transcriptional regulator [Ulvibacterium marinum]RKN82967.1 Crp/Fnr family transcriptional regulator [Ulvibacterium marinum]
MQHIREHLESFAPLSDDDWFIFKSKLVFENYPKNSIILKEGTTENYLSFIESGVARLYIPKIDNDLTFGFAFAHSFVSAYDSFLTQSPCTYQIQSITPTKLWRINYDDLQAIYEETAIGNEIGRKNAENLFLIKSKRELALLNKSAKERYLELFSERPELIREIPLKYIASYIGITPQALSRIRRQIS